MTILDEVVTEQSERIHVAFAQGEAWGILRLAISELGTRLAPSLEPLRAIGCAYLERLCVGRRRHRLTRLEIDDEVAAELKATGLPEAVARRHWNDLGATLEIELRGRGENVGEWIKRAAPGWDDVGRVVFHLTERPENREHPFHFFASFGVRVGGVRVGATAKVRFVPLGRAIRGAAKQSRFVAVTRAIFWAAERNACIGRIYDRGLQYQSVDFAPDDALEFLEAIPVLTRAGVVVRAPAYRPKSPPDVRIRIGEQASILTEGALLDFSLEVALGGETLSEQELREILARNAPLVSIRGKWVGVDPEALALRVARWRDVSHVSVATGLGLLAGTVQDIRPVDEDDPPEGPWLLSDVPPAQPRFVAGKALSAALDQLARPDLGAADPGAALRTELRGYQKTGVAWLWQLQRLGIGGCLADDMGLGKTVQVLALLLLMKARGLGATLLVAPASLLANWSAEAARFAPDLRVVIAHGSYRIDSWREQLESADLVITTYGSLRRQALLNQAVAGRRWRLVVLDEAQAIKNPRSRAARAAKDLSSDTRLALTGTPVENGLEDLWSLFDFVRPGLLGTQKAFAALCESLASKAKDGAPTAAHFEPLRRLVRPYILRRAKTDRSLLPELPDKSELKAYCTLTRTQAALYQQEVDNLASALENAKGMARRGLILGTLVRLKQICNHPSQLLGDGVYDFAMSGKLARMRELCVPIAEAGERVLVFTQFREMTEPLAVFLESIFGRRGLILSGETEIAERRALVDAFQAPASPSNPGPPFFVLSLRAGGTGLTLTAASHVIHFDRWWNPAVENQATDRAYRIGQKKNVLVHKLVCRGTLEERVDELIDSKRSLAANVIESGGELLLTELGREQLLDLVRLDARTALDSA